MKKPKKYWCVAGETYDIAEVYVEAKNKKQARKLAMSMEDFSEEPEISEVSKKEYEDNI